MAILTRSAFYPAERFDTPDARALEAFSANDWKYFLTGVMTSKSMIISGFDISNYSKIFTFPGLKIQQSNVSLLHPEATTQAVGFYVSAGTEPDSVISLNPGSTNYIEVDLSTTTGTPDTRAFWDPGANGGAGQEYTDTIDTVINLNLSITTNVSAFTAGRIPLYKVVTNNAGTVTSLTDCRPMMFRLGTGGSSPNPQNLYTPISTPDLAHAALETPITSTSATTSNAPYLGGDKNIKSMKQWMDWMMSQVKQGFSLPYWYSKPATSIAGAFQNAALTLLAGGTYSQLGLSSKVVSATSTSVIVAPGTAFTATASAFQIGSSIFSYAAYSVANSQFSGVTPNPVTAATPGVLVQQGEIGHLSLTNGTQIVRFGQASSQLLPFSDVDLTAYRTLFVILSNDAASLTYGMGADTTSPIKVKKATSVTNNSITVPTGGNYVTSSGKIYAQGGEFSYTSYVPATGVFLSISPDPSGLLSVGSNIYQASNGTQGYYHVAASGDVPGVHAGISEGAERVLWIAYFDGNNTVFIKDSELVPGESASIATTEDQIYKYVGSSGASDNFPVYNVNSIGNGTDLTLAIQKAFNIIETPIYDETILVSGTGYAVGDYVTLPVNTRSGNNPGAYSVGTGELQIYHDGILLEPKNDYLEVTSTQIQVQRAFLAGERLRLRISSVGGAGAAAGSGQAGITLQGAYGNGHSIITSPGQPVIIDGSGTGKYLHVAGDVQIDGMIDPTGISFTPQAVSPIPSSQPGIWFQRDAGGTGQHKAIITNSDGSTTPLQQIVEQVGGDAQYFARNMRNQTGATIPAGSAVTIVGPGMIDLADESDVQKYQVFGIATRSIASGSTGPVIYCGVVTGVFTGMGLISGNYVWLGSTPGSLSTTPPSSSNSVANVVVGIVDGNDLIIQIHVNGRTTV